jgi:hypothetical protein
VTLRRGRPVAFIWHGHERQAQVIGRWNKERHAERWYWRVMTADFQVFELYRENGVRWVLDVV